MNEKYKSDIAKFKKTFEKYRTKRIVLYGTGVYTAVLLPEITEFNIVGVMDRDLNNLGKLFLDIPFVSKDNIEKKADLIIINTIPDYWDIIYKRIKDVKIPVYFRNGQIACEKEYKRTDLIYWKQTKEELQQKIKENDVISFDFFDTLFMRKVYLPEDVWKIVEQKIRSFVDLKDSFCLIRKKAEKFWGESNTTFNQIYQRVKEITGLGDETIQKIQKIEKQTELELLVPRIPVLEMMKKAIASGKEVYILSDMYLPSDWYRDVLRQYGIKVDDDKIWVSCEKNVSKRDESIWKVWNKDAWQRRSMLHIGDNWNADVQNPAKYGINTYYIMSGRDMLLNSSLNAIVPQICSIQESKISGLLISKLFHNPYSLNREKGVIYLENAEDFGYCVFGPVINAFFRWLLQELNDCRIQNIYFLSRDGYFLYEDFKYYISEILHLKERAFDAIYLFVSRRLSAFVSIENDAEFREYASYPFEGTFSEYMDIRFSIAVDMCEQHAEEYISLPGDYLKVYDWINHYKERITQNIIREKTEYLQYLKNSLKNDALAIVDLWFEGNTQNYLSKLTYRKFKGYYFAVNMSDSNKCFQNNEMKPCFQLLKDYKAEKCRLFKNYAFVESFLTAPYGMVKSVSAHGKVVCCENQSNQKYFTVKRDINNGIKKFLEDYARICDVGMENCCEEERRFADQLFGLWMDGAMEMSDEIKKCFWTDNQMVSKREFRIFE